MSAASSLFLLQYLKPILAEWSYLWLQKQHLHGIDRDEAIKYILEGAVVVTLHLGDHDSKTLRQLRGIGEDFDAEQNSRKATGGIFFDRILL